MNLFSAFLLLGIIDDIFNFGTSWFKDDEQGTSLTVRETASSSFFLPEAVGAPVAPVIPIIGGIILRKGVQQLSKSAIKAAKKKAKNQARVSGKQRNKTRHQPGGSEHTSNIRNSSRGKHQKGQARKKKDQARAEEREKAKQKKKVQE